MIDEQIIKYGFGAFISYYVIKELIQLIRRFITKTELNTNDISKQLKTFVDKEDCRSFRRRLGKESDDHTERIMEIKEDVSEIKEGIAYLKGKTNARGD